MAVVSFLLSGTIFYIKIKYNNNGNPTIKLSTSVVKKRTKRLLQYIGRTKPSNDTEPLTVPIFPDGVRTIDPISMSLHSSSSAADVLSSPDQHMLLESAPSPPRTRSSLDSTGDEDDVEPVGIAIPFPLGGACRAGSVSGSTCGGGEHDTGEPAPTHSPIVPSPSYSEFGLIWQRW